MVMTKDKLRGGDSPMEDDGWWESLMTEEERCLPSQRRPTSNQTEITPSSMEVSAPDWEKATAIFQQDQIIAGKVGGFNRGGLLVENFGIQGFVPYSHLLEMNDLRESEREKILAAYVGRSLNLKIIECIPTEGRLVFSERAARAEVGCRNRLFKSLQTGQRILGEVTNLTDFGAFIDLGGVEGLIHISELSWGRVEHPSQILSVGEKSEVMVLEVVPERCRVALSLKRLIPNPWNEINSLYAVSDIVNVTITSIVSYGMFARLEQGLEGLIHSTELPGLDEKAVRATYSVGQVISARILQVDAAHQRLGLSLKLEN